MRSSDDFRRTVRSGARAARPTLVVHVRPADGVTRVGFVVSKAVGNAVERNRVKRRLRHLVKDLLVRTPAGFDVVVRALPPAAHESTGLADDLNAAWHAAFTKVERQP